MLESKPAPSRGVRAFFVSGERDGDPAVVFRLWRPYTPEGSYLRCRYEFITSTGSRSTEAAGIDGLDCIVAALSMAGSDLAGMNESLFRGRLRWEASPGGGRGLGSPTLEDGWSHTAIRNAGP
jgi:hypothetical protein